MMGTRCGEDCFGVRYGVTAARCGEDRRGTRCGVAAADCLMRTRCGVTAADCLMRTRSGRIRRSEAAVEGRRGSRGLLGGLGGLGGLGRCGLTAVDYGEIAMSWLDDGMRCGEDVDGLRRCGEDIEGLRRCWETAVMIRCGITAAGRLNDGIDLSLTVARDTGRDDVFGCRLVVPARYPGGLRGWRTYVNRATRYPTAARRLNIEGEVRVLFTIDANGRTGDIKILCGPGLDMVTYRGEVMGVLEREAVRVIRHSGRWTPASYRGKPEEEYRVQPFIFKLE